MLLLYVIIMLSLIVAVSVVFRIIGERAFKPSDPLQARENPENEELKDLEEILPLITAVAYVVFKKPVTVKRIKLFDSENEGSWNLAGQISMMSSHKLK